MQSIFKWCLYRSADVLTLLFLLVMTYVFAADFTLKDAFTIFPQALWRWQIDAFYLIFSFAIQSLEFIKFFKSKLWRFLLQVVLLSIYTSVLTFYVTPYSLSLKVIMLHMLIFLPLISVYSILFYMFEKHFPAKTPYIETGTFD